MLLQEHPPLADRYPDVKLTSRDDPEAIRKAIDKINYSLAVRKRRASKEK